MAKKRRQRPRLKPKSSRSQQAQQKLPTWAWFVGGGVLAILLVLGLFYLGNQGPATASGDIEGLNILPDPGRGHIDGDIEYASAVPAGGAHNPTWLNCGIYQESVRLENVIHSMEHGAVWLAYRPDLPQEQVDFLHELVRQERRQERQPLIVLAPQPGLDSPLIATAWRAQLRLEDAFDERLAQFLDRFQNGPFTPEPLANCAGGIGEPLN